MASSLNFTVLLILAMVVVSANGQDKVEGGGPESVKNVVEVGEKEKGDSELYNETVTKINSEPTPITFDIVAARNNCKINYYRVVDNTEHGFGANPQEIEGGLGTTRIVLRLTSVPTHGIKADVEIRCVETAE